MTPTIRAVISDLDGVVYRGDTAIDTAVEAIRSWAARDVPFAFVTNNSTHSAEAFAMKLDRLGIPVSADLIVTPIEATVATIRARYPPGLRTYVIGSAALIAAVGAAGAEVVDSDDAALVVLGTDYGLTFDKLRRATRALLAGADLIATNPDRLAPTETGLEPCVGSVLAIFTAALPQLQPLVMGKPAPAMVEEAMRRLGVGPEETVMVGDQIATDILAGEAAGLRSFLVTTGLPVKATTHRTSHKVIASLLDIAAVGPDIMAAPSV